MPSFLTSFKSYCLCIHYFDDALTFILQICGIHNCTFSTNYKALTQELLVDMESESTHRYILSRRHKAARKIQHS